MLQLKYGTSSMADYLGNPALIYEGPNWLPTPGVPLILMHDGGGTTFSYHCLDPTNRPLYGVENPHLHEGGWWDGGIPEMAKHYIDLMAKALPQGGRVILGGRFSFNELVCDYTELTLL